VARFACNLPCAWHLLCAVTTPYSTPYNNVSIHPHKHSANCPITKTWLSALGRRSCTLGSWHVVGVPLYSPVRSRSRLHTGGCIGTVPHSLQNCSLKSCIARVLAERYGILVVSLIKMKEETKKAHHPILVQLCEPVRAGRTMRPLLERAPLYRDFFCTPYSVYSVL
jgi:hypothetical protein